ncbi:MAG: hypothetical protein J6S67_20995 [Methanobrevibacter sp.]|nr:hypothetical protein [Methanobrevibacter sp.]
MWVTTDYKGNTVKWYEAELIELIRKECKAQVHYMKSKFAQRILDLIQENENG